MSNHSTPTSNTSPSGGNPATIPGVAGTSQWDPVNNTELGARKSLNGLWSTGLTDENSVYDGLDLPPAVNEGFGKLLEFPQPVGTDELNHFIVFTVYHGLEASMSQDDIGLWGGAKTEQLLAGAATMVAGAGLAGYVGPKLINKISASSASLSKLPKIGPIVSLFAAAAGAYFGWQIGSAQTVTLTEEQKESLAKFDEIANAVQANVDAAGYAEHGADWDPKQSGRLTRFGKALFRHDDTIALYMPQKIQAMSLLEYEQQDMSFIQNILNDWTGLASKMGMVNLPKFADSAAGILGMNTNLSAAVYGALRLAPNSRKQLMFREPVSRKFEFNFNLSPRNPKESAIAYEIIQTFKRHAYPTLSKTLGNGAFYNFPAEFQIEYYTLDENGNPVENDFVNKIGRCSLREINIDYASSGSFSTFENGAPTNMLMSLTFEEMELLDSGMIDKGY